MAETERTPDPHGLFSPDRLRSMLILVLLLVALYGVFQIIKPYLHAIILGALLVGIFSPVHRWMLRKTKNRTNQAAALTCTVVALVVLIPLAGFTSTLVYRGINTFRAVQEWVVMFNEEAGDLLKDEQELDADGQPLPPEEPTFEQAIRDGMTDEERIQQLLESPRLQAIRESRILHTVLYWKERLFPAWQFDLAATRAWIIKKSDAPINFLGDKVMAGLTNVFILLMNFFLMLFVMFYFFRDGERIMAYLLKLSPLSIEQEQLMIERVKEVTKSAFVGTILTAIIQGMIGMVGLAIAGVPWLVWGVMMGISSLVPIVGTALVWIPIVGYLLIIGATWQAVFLTLWCAILVGGADNILRPMLMQGKTGMSSMLLFFAILGGIQLFGLLGVIYGPLIFGIAAVMLYIFQLETAGRRQQIAVAAAGPAPAVLHVAVEEPRQPPPPPKSGKRKSKRKGL